ncbi:hypothetical protein GOV04_02115 [Candidatus Woesearchaeota archaeon]|nr:hypothetical protein [Candidatus Woesearchaeota archaeon]
MNSESTIELFEGFLRGPDLGFGVRECLAFILKADHSQWVSLVNDFFMVYYVNGLVAPQSFESDNEIAWTVIDSFADNSPSLESHTEMVVDFLKALESFNGSFEEQLSFLKALLASKRISMTFEQSVSSALETTVALTIFEAITNAFNSEEETEDDTPIVIH